MAISMTEDMVKNMKPCKIERQKVYLIGYSEEDKPHLSEKVVCDCNCDTFWHQEDEHFYMHVGHSKILVQCTNCGLVYLVPLKLWKAVPCE